VATKQAAAREMKLIDGLVRLLADIMHQRHQLHLHEAELYALQSASPVFDGTLQSKAQIKTGQNFLHTKSPEQNQASKREALQFDESARMLGDDVAALMRMTDFLYKALIATFLKNTRNELYIGLRDVHGVEVCDTTFVSRHSFDHHSIINCHQNCCGTKRCSDPLFVPLLPPAIRTTSVVARSIARPTVCMSARAG
jgi:hypothetical protein